MHNMLRNEASFRPRHEMKFIVPRMLANSIREYISSFCEADPMAVGSPPRYKVTTLQLDSPGLSLHLAKDRELKNRFKLRVRSYGDADGTCPIFVEIKRKFNHIVSKSRVKLSRDSYVEDLAEGLSNGASPGFSSLKDRDTFGEFVRLSRSLDAGPVMRIRYERECWVGIEDSTVRITIDDKLEYQPTVDYRVFAPNQPWYQADLSVVTKRKDDLVILELKCGMDVPAWLIHLVKQYRLERIGFCKYSEAVKLETIFAGLGSFPQLHFRGSDIRRARHSRV